MSFFPFTFKGLVIDERGEHLGEADVHLLSYSRKAVAEVRTDLEGHFSLRVLVEPGEYVLEVDLPGFETGREAVEVQPKMEGKTLILMLRRNISRPALSRSP